MWVEDLIVGSGSAAVGAVTAELLARRRGARVRARGELRRIRRDLAALQQAQAIAREAARGLTQRLEDVLDRLNAADRPRQTPPQTPA